MTDCGVSNPTAIACQAQILDHPHHFPICDPLAVNLVTPIAGQTKMDTRETGNGAAGPDHVSRTAGKRLSNQVGLLPAGHLRAGMIQHGGHGLCILEMPEGLCQGDHANRKADNAPNGGPVQQAMQRRIAQVPGIDQQDLGGSATNIDHENMVGIRHDQVMTPHHGQPRLFTRRYDLETQACFSSHALNEFSSVLGLPAGFRRNATHMGHLFRLELVRNLMQRIHRPLNRRIRELSSGVQPFAKPGDLRMRIEYGKSRPVGGGDK